jgi:hypothetical protein
LDKGRLTEAEYNFQLAELWSRLTAEAQKRNLAVANTQAAQDEAQAADRQATAAMLPDAWEDSIREFLIAHNPDSVTVGQIARQALSIETPRIGTADQRRIAAALERLDWKRSKREPETGNRIWRKVEKGKLL